MTEPFVRPSSQRLPDMLYHLSVAHKLSTGPHMSRFWNLNRFGKSILEFCSSLVIEMSPAGPEALHTRSGEIWKVFR